MFDTRVLGTAVLAILAAGCASTPGPNGYLRPAQEAQHQAYGAWIEVKLEPNRSPLQGEFIAADADTIFVLTPTRLATIPKSDIERARLGTYDAQWEPLAGWSAVGALTTVSHGWYAGLSLPLWVIGGTIATAAASHGPIEGVNGQDTARWLEVSKFARFPQGMPPELDRTTLSPALVVRRPPRP